MCYICRINFRATKSVSTHEGAFSSLLNLPPGACSQIFNRLNLVEHFVGWKFCSRGWSIPMKSLVHTEELCSRSVPLEHAPGAKPLVCIGLKIYEIFLLSRSKLHNAARPQPHLLLIVLENNVIFFVCYSEFKIIRLSGSCIRGNCLFFKAIISALSSFTSSEQFPQGTFASLLFGSSSLK